MVITMIIIYIYIYIYIFAAAVLYINYGYFGTYIFQVSIQKGKGTMDLNMFLLMKTKKVIGCWLEMFHGSKFSISPDLLISIIKPLYIYIYMMSQSWQKAVCYWCSMFISSCKKLRIMKGSETSSLGCLWQPTKAQLSRRRKRKEKKRNGDLIWIWNMVNRLVTDRLVRLHDFLGAGFSLFDRF